MKAWKSSNIWEQPKEIKIQEEIKSRLNSGNACYTYHSVQNLLSSSLPSINLKLKIYRTIILLVVFMGVRLGRSHWGRNAGWRCLSRIFVHKRYEVRGELRKLHNAELNNLYSLPNNVRVIESRSIRWAEHAALMGERRGVYRVLVGKPEGKRPLGRHRNRWEDNIKMVLREVGCGDEHLRMQ